MNRPIFVFDLNGVALKFSPLKALRVALGCQHKLRLLSAILNPSLIWQVLKLAYQGTVVEQAILELPQTHPKFASLVPLALQMANQQILVPKTVQLIAELKTAGYQIYAFSNLGQQSAQILNQKYPDFFKLFDGILVTTPQDNYLMKPDPAAFDKFLNQFQLDPKQLVLIDDKLENIIAARKYGITGIKFINPCQCRREIWQLLNR